ncbi:hypothetical protein U1Q18_006188 [Sarracenia purpurea var. burkii]
MVNAMGVYLGKITLRERGRGRSGRGEHNKNRRESGRSAIQKMEWAPEADKNQIGPRSRNPDRDPSSNRDPQIEQPWPNVRMEIRRRTTAKGDKRDDMGAARGR